MLSLVSCHIDLSNPYYRRGRLLRIVVIAEKDLKEFQSYGAAGNDAVYSVITLTRQSGT